MALVRILPQSFCRPGMHRALLGRTLFLACIPHSSFAVNANARASFAPPLRMTASDADVSVSSQPTKSQWHHHVFQSKRDAFEHVSKAAHSSPSLVRCGELACQRDSTRRNVESSALLSYAIFREAAASKKKKNKKGNGDRKNRADGGAPPPPSSASCRYALVLDDSVFFPEGGGQPADMGKIAFLPQATGTASTPTPPSPVLELSVTDAQNVNGACVLSCRAAAGRGVEGEIDPSDGEAVSEILREWCLQPSDDGDGDGDGGDDDPGAPPRCVVRQEVDWDRRSDLMTQHSAQHLISAVAQNDPFGIETSSISLHADHGNMCYIDFVVDPDTDLDGCRKVMRDVEEAANELIRENRPMTPRWAHPDDLESETQLRSRLLPAGFSGKLRLVEIDGVDVNTCCGTHVPTLGQLQMIKLFRIERVKAALLRVRFAAGDRLRRMVDDAFERQSTLTALLSCPEDEHARRVSRLLDDGRERDREIKALGERLCSCRAEGIWVECRGNGNVAVVDLGDGYDMKFMTMLAGAVLDKNAGCGDGMVLLLVEGAEGADEGTFLLSSGDADLVARLGKRVAELFGGRGGGGKGGFQGKGTRIRSRLHEAEQVLKEEIRNL